MANFFKEYMITPNFLNKFSNLGLLGNTSFNLGTIGNAANDYVKGTPSQGIISDTITGKNNWNSSISQAIDDRVKNPTSNTMQLADALAGGLEDLGSGLGKIGSSFNAKKQNGYQIKPSNVNYSQFMGLSPETKRYFYGGM